MRERGPTRVRYGTRALALAAGLMALMTVARIEAADPPRLDAARIESLRQTATEQASLPKSLFDGLKVDPSQTLPQVLSADQAERYAEIFRLQAEASWARADKEIKLLKDKRLLGAVLAQRYTHAKYRSKYDEPASWQIGRAHV